MKNESVASTYVHRKGGKERGGGGGGGGGVRGASVCTSPCTKIIT